MGQWSDFNFAYQRDVNSTQQVETTTTDGAAHVSYRIQNTGTLTITAESDPALKSQALLIEVPSPVGAEATIVVLSTPLATETPSPSPTVVQPTQTEIPVINSITIPTFPDILDWFAMVIILAITTGVLYLFSRTRIPIRWSVRWILLSIIGGIVTYIFSVFQISVKASWTQSLRSLDLMAITIAGLFMGWTIGMIWYLSSKKNLKKGLFSNRQ